MPPESDSFVKNLKELHLKEEQLIDTRLSSLKVEIQKLSAQLPPDNELKIELEKELAETEGFAEKLKGLHQKEEQLIEERLGALQIELKSKADQ